MFWPLKMSEPKTFGSIKVCLDDKAEQASYNEYHLTVSFTVRACCIYSREHGHDQKTLHHSHKYCTALYLGLVTQGHVYCLYSSMTISPRLPSPPLASPPPGPSRPPQCSGVPLSAVAASWPTLHPSLPPTDGGGGEVPAQRQRTDTGHVRVSGWASPQYQYSSGFIYDATMSLYNIIIESIISTSHAVNKMFFEESTGYNQPIKNVIS